MATSKELVQARILKKLGLAERGPEFDFADFRHLWTDIEYRVCRYIFVYGTRWAQVDVPLGYEAANVVCLYSLLDEVFVFYSFYGDLKTEEKSVYSRTFIDHGETYRLEVDYPDWLFGDEAGLLV